MLGIISLAVTLGVPVFLFVLMNARDTIGLSSHEFRGLFALVAALTIPAILLAKRIQGPYKHLLIVINLLSLSYGIVMLFAMTYNFLG